MPQYRGVDGSFTWAAGVVSEVQEWTANISQAMLDGSSMGNIWKVFKGGQSEWTGAAKVNLDYGNTNQKAMLDSLILATPLGQSYACELIATTTGPKKFTGTVLISSIALSAPIGGLVTAQFSLRGTGALAISWT